jgi:hypothetical protein
VAVAAPSYGLLFAVIPETVRFFELIERGALPLLAATELSPAKLAPTPFAYEPALIPDRATFDKVATPEAFVTAELPAKALPFSVNAIVFPLTAAPPDV